MILIKCKECGSEKDPLTGFYANDKKCKDCRKILVKENRLKNIEYYKAYDNARSSDPKRVEARKAYAKTEQGKKSANHAKKRWTESNKIKRAAANAVNNAIRDGVLEKPRSCESCGKTGCRIEGHHDDYRNHLSVRWLCSFCHRKWHKENGKGLNA